MNEAIANSSVTVHNITNIAFSASPVVAVWTVWPILSLLLLIFAFSGNGILLILFMKNVTLRTPFNMYIINLLIGNLASCILQYPWDITSSLYPESWFLGEQVCTLYMYAIFVIQGVIYNSHLLIAINRVWAVKWPLHYRTKHNAKIAVTLCVSMWALVNIILLPGLVLDALYYRHPVENYVYGCFFNADALPVLNIVTQLLTTNIALLGMLVALPIICTVKILRHRKLVGLVGPVSESAQRTELVVVKTHGAIVEEPEANRSGPHIPPVLGPMASHIVVKARNQPISKGLFLLALLTVSVLVTWTPSSVIFVLSPFVDLNVNMGLLYVITNHILFSAQTVIDPILFTCALRNVRTGLLTFVRCSRSA